MAQCGSPKRAAVQPWRRTLYRAARAALDARGPQKVHPAHSKAARQRPQLACLVLAGRRKHPQIPSAQCDF
jgi:hypothetical protein